MPTTTISPNMNLPVPVVGVDPGPDWATQINNCMALIDSHTHATGSGVQINPSGIDINADLSFAGNNLTLVRSTRFQNQTSTLSGVADLNCAYSSGTGGDLYYNDGSGNKIRITQSGSIVGTTGSIGGLVSPASATYVPANQTFVWQSAANTAANLDCGSVILRNITVSSYGLTLAPPSSLALNYTITLPTIPAVSNNFLTMDTSGNIASNIKLDNSTLVNSSNTIAVAASALVDNSTTEASSNQIIVKDAGITSAKLAANSVTTSAIANANVTLPKLDSTLSFFMPKVMCNWNAIQTSGTYTRSGFTVTVSMTNHGMTTGQIAGLVFSAGTGGTATSGSYAITSTGTNSFTIQDTVSGSITGTPAVTRNYYIYISYNVTNITYHSVGNFTVNFTNALSNTNIITVTGCGNRTSATNAYMIAPTNASPFISTTAIRLNTTDTSSGTNFSDNNIVIYGT